MSKTRKENTVHNWSDDEIEALLRAAVLDDDCWCYCRVCGMEISPIEPDASASWCEQCNSKVRAEGLRNLGLI